MKNIKKKEILIIVLFYIFFSFLYRIVLWYNGLGYQKEGFWGWLNFRDYWFMAGMQYFFYFLSSIFIWFLGVKLLIKKKTILQITVVALLIPIVVYFVREGRYLILDKIG